MSLELFNIDKGYAVFSKGNYETAKHSHYAIESVFCTEGSFSITTNLSEYTNIKSVIIPSNITHSFSCLNAKCNLLFLDPLSDIGTYFLQQYNLASQKNIVVNPPALNQFHKKDEFDVSLMLNNAKANRAGHLDFRIIKCIETMNTLVADEKLTVSKLSRASLKRGSFLLRLSWESGFC